MLQHIQSSTNLQPTQNYTIQQGYDTSHINNNWITLSKLQSVNKHNLQTKKLNALR